MGRHARRVGDARGGDAGHALEVEVGLTQTEEQLAEERRLGDPDGVPHVRQQHPVLEQGALLALGPCDIRHQVLEHERVVREARHEGALHRAAVAGEAVQGPGGAGHPAERGRDVVPPARVEVQPVVVEQHAVARRGVGRLGPRALLGGPLPPQVLEQLALEREGLHGLLVEDPQARGQGRVIRTSRGGTEVEQQEQGGGHREAFARRRGRDAVAWVRLLGGLRQAPMTLSFGGRPDEGPEPIGARTVLGAWAEQVSPWPALGSAGGLIHPRLGRCAGRPLAWLPAARRISCGGCSPSSSRGRARR